MTTALGSNVIFVRVTGAAAFPAASVQLNARS
jgi:hypothetical protein